jgi:hypothetical protein
VAPRLRTGQNYIVTNVQSSGWIHWGGSTNWANATGTRASITRLDLIISEGLLVYCYWDRSAIARKRPFGCQGSSQPAKRSSIVALCTSGQDIGAGQERPAERTSQPNDRSVAGWTKPMAWLGSGPIWSPSVRGTHLDLPLLLALVRAGPGSRNPSRSQIRRQACCPSIRSSSGLLHVDPA